MKIGASQSGLGGLLAGARQRDDTMTLSDGESLMGDPRVDHGTDHGPGGCTVSVYMQDQYITNHTTRIPVVALKYLNSMIRDRIAPVHTPILHDTSCV